jgi:hypothetical protein
MGFLCEWPRFEEDRFITGPRRRGSESKASSP